MLNFFRRIRRSLLTKNKLSKYLLYALGEILLVVLGILIALQINNWNAKKIDANKEQLILLEIQENLYEDLQNIETILKFNELKLKTIDSAYYYMSKMNENPLLGREFSNLLPIITNYEIFTPSNVAFNNMIASGNIDILSSNELRQKISRYYSNDILDGVQDQIKVTTQNFLNEVAPKMMNKNMLKFITNRDFDVISVEDIKVHKDPYVLSDLFVMHNKTRDHIKILDKVIIEIKSLTKSINKYIKG